MTPVGHSLTGVAIGIWALPRQGRGIRFAWLLGFIFLANLPDLPLPGWGHQNYLLSHSVVVHGMVSLLVLLAVKWKAPSRLRLAGLGVLAVFSHMLLDSFYSHGLGIAVCWPLSEARLNLQMPWFHQVQFPLREHPENLLVFGRELVLYGIVLLLSLGVRKLRTDALRP